MNMIIDAARFAAEAHRDQRRKYTGDPYIFHPARVAARTTLLPNATEEMIAVAWLHDVLEDCAVNETVLRQRFGSKVADLVRNLTNPSKRFPEWSRVHKKRLDREHLAEVPFEAKQIKAIDRIDNLRELSGATPDFIKMYTDESRELAAVLNLWPTQDLISEILKECRVLEAKAGL